jgi:hypothetical protein
VEHKLQVFGNKVFRKIFGPEKRALGYCTRSNFVIYADYILLLVLRNTGGLHGLRMWLGLRRQETYTEFWQPHGKLHFEDWEGDGSWGNV